MCNDSHYTLTLEARGDIDTETRTYPHTWDGLTDAITDVSDFMRQGYSYPYASLREIVPSSNTDIELLCYDA